MGNFCCRRRNYEFINFEEDSEFLSKDSKNLSKIKEERIETSSNNVSPQSKLVKYYIYFKLFREKNPKKK